MELKKLNQEEFICNPFTKIGKEWMLISSGDKTNFNTMTASWGGLGVMWGKNVAFTFIRPQRYTREFIEKNEQFSLCFFDTTFQKTLSYLGSVSGRDENKIEKCGLTPDFIENVPYFKEAKLVLICKKLYCQDLSPSCFLENSLDEKWYPNKDYHFMYVSEIQKIYKSY